MILVLLGTSSHSFLRLVKAVDEYARTSGREVFIQIGNTEDYIPVHAKYEKFLSKQELLKKIDEAELVITQGGFGSIADCLLAEKKVISVPRKPELGEAHHHQEELVRELEKSGRIIGVYEIENLSQAIGEAESRDFQKGHKTMIPDIIQQFLEKHSE